MGFAVGCPCKSWALLRPGEFYALTFREAGIYDRSGKKKSLLLAIKRPKNQWQMGKRQVAVVEDVVAIRWLEWLSKSCLPDEPLLRRGRTHDW